MSGETRCTYNGRVYLIPDIWLAGMCFNNGRTIEEAVAYWAWQTELEEAAS